jgi:hypothetical protein
VWEPRLRFIRGTWLVVALVVAVAAGSAWSVWSRHLRFPSDHGLAELSESTPGIPGTDWACAIGTIAEHSLPGTEGGWEVAADPDPSGDGFWIVTPGGRYEAFVVEGRLWYRAVWGLSARPLEC